jgi:hypothetical protein
MTAPEIKYKTSNGIYYEKDSVVGAEPDTFEVLNHVWARDSKAVYAYGKKQTKPDLYSFTVLNNMYAKDKNQVYYLTGKASLTSVINDADPLSFEVLDNGYYEYEVPEKQIIGRPHLGGYARDKNQVFYGQLLGGKPRVVASGAKIDLFRVIKYSYADDGENLYIFGEKIKEVDRDSFEILSPRWAKDKAHVYCDNKISKIDPQIFQITSRTPNL